MKFCVQTLKKAAALLLAAVMALSVFTGCGAAASSAAGSTAASAAQTVTATLRVTDPDGAVTEVALTCTEGETLAAALAAAGVISEEEAASGFVTVVNGITADWNADGAWWCVVDADGQMTPVGIGDILLADGDVYGMVYTRG